MTNPYREITCFVLAGGETSSIRDFEQEGELTRLESIYRRYAKVFEKVMLVLKTEQARERYLNYPHVCDRQPGRNVMHGIEAALENADSDTTFIGSSAIADFPPELIVRLIRDYRGESFLGYCAGDGSACQPLFGLYNRRLADKLKSASLSDRESLISLVRSEGRFIPLPAEVSAARIGLRN